MCGINGIVSGNDAIKRKIIGMNKLLRHRGPDDEGFVMYNSQVKKWSVYSGDASVTKIKSRFKNIAYFIFIER